MYKVFFNEKQIIFTESGKITFSKPGVKTIHFPNEKSIKKVFFEFIESSNKTLVVVNESPTYLFKKFKKKFKVINASGGVVLRDKKILFIFRNEKWDLPKGKVDKGESIEDGAIREVAEECGIINHTIEKKLPSTFHIYQSPYSDTKGKWIFKETFWFEMAYSGLEDGTPQIDENITEIRWFSQNDLNAVLENTYENLKQIITIYLD